MCAQCIWWCSVHRGDIFNSSGISSFLWEGCHEYIRGGGGGSVHWRDIMATLREHHKYIRGCSVHWEYHDSCGEYFEYIGGFPVNQEDIITTSGRYHDLCGRAFNLY